MCNNFVAVCTIVIFDRDIKKARLLLKSVITTNPQHGPGRSYNFRFSSSKKKNLIKKAAQTSPLTAGDLSRI